MKLVLQNLRVVGHSNSRTTKILKGAKEPWVVITDENPSLQTLWQYGLRSLFVLPLILNNSQNMTIRVSH